jgi:hypothetical protein
MSRISEEKCYAEGDENAEYCSAPKAMHCAMLGDATFWGSAEGREHLVRCMRDDHFIHHKFQGKEKLVGD